MCKPSFRFFVKSAPFLQPFGPARRQKGIIIQNSKDMKKLLLLLVAVLALGSCGARHHHANRRQTTSVRHVRPFERIEVKGACNVKYVQADSFSVKVVGGADAVDNLLTEFVDNALRIRMKEGFRAFSLDRRGMVPTVYVSSPDLVAVNMLGAGEFEASEAIDTDTLTVFLKGAGDIDLGHVVCDEFRSTLHGVGNVGVAELATQRADIRLKGVGNVDVRFVDGGVATAQLEGVGNITLAGSLRSLQKTVRGTGNIDTDDLEVAE